MVIQIKLYNEIIDYYLLLFVCRHTVYIPDAAPSASPEVTVSMVVDEKVAEPMIWRISFNVSGMNP